MRHALSLGLLALLLLVPTAVAQETGTGTYYGDGSDGAITRTVSGSETSSAVIQATTYTIESGVTRTCSQSNGVAMVILATASINIQGTLDCSGRGSTGGTAGTAGVNGIGIGGSGSTSTGSVAGGNANSPRFLWSAFQCAASGAAILGAGGGGGGQGDTVNGRSGGSGAGGLRNGGASGSSGATAAVAGTPGTGGNGGGAILLVAPTITLGPGSSLLANGANGATGTGNSGGGGGGAGGLVCLWSTTLTLDAGHSIAVNGGNGGNGGPGATGGQGGTLANPNPTAGTSASTGGGAGGGGAVGLVVKKTGAPVPFPSLLATTPEAPGSNCADGGFWLQHGLDNGDGAGTARDSVLQAGEVDGTAYLCHGQAGAQGPVGITWQGSWDDDASYAVRDAVHYAGSAWYALQPSLNSAPYPGSPDWDFIANADGVLVDGDVEEEQAAWQETLGEYAYFLFALYYGLSRFIRAKWVPFAGLIRIVLDVVGLGILQLSGLPETQFARIAAAAYGFLVLDCFLALSERRP